MKKWLIIAGIVVLVLVLLAGSGWLWLTRSESGARWAMARAAGTIEQLEYRSLSGGLASGVTLDGLEFAHAGTRVTADRLELAARIELLGGPRVVVRHLRGRGIDIHLPAGETPADPSDEPLDLSALASPIEVVIEDLDLRELTIHGGEQAQRIERITLAGRYGTSIALERFEIVADQGHATAQGQWALERRGSGQLTVDASTELENGVRQSARITLSGQFDALDFELTSSGPAAVEGRGRLRGLPGTPSIETELTGTLANWPGLPVTVEDLTLGLSGRADEWTATSSARVTGSDVPPGQWSLALSGGMQSLTIDSLDANILDGRITGSGALDWSESAPASRASLKLESLDLTPLYPDWPEQGRIGGELSLATEAGVIEIEGLDLHADPGELSVTGSGRIDPAGDRIDATLEWRHFAWPPVTDDSEPLLASESGRLRLEGRISEWRAQLDALFESPQTPAAQVQARASGSRERATIERFHVDAGDHGTLALDGTVAWLPSLSAELSLVLDGFDPGVFVRQLPGRIDGEAAIRLAREEHWQVDVGMVELAGDLRGQALSASGHFAWTHDRPESADLSVQLGDNRVALINNDPAAWQVDFDGVALEQLWPELEGQVELAGELKLGESRMTISGQVDDLLYRNYNLEQAELALEFGWAGQPQIDLVISGSNLGLQPWDRLEQVELKLVGSCAAHRLELNASGNRGSLDLAANGRLAECRTGGRQWAGEVTRLFMAETLAGDWRLAEAMPLSISPAQVRVGATCLGTAADSPARLCIEQLDVGERGQAAVRLEQVPMDLLLLPLDPVFSLTTPLSGRVEAAWGSAGLSRLDGALQLDAGALRAIGGEQDLLGIDSARIDLEPGAGRSLALALQARLEGATELNGQARLADLRELTATEIAGDARLHLPDIGAFGHLLPALDRIGGSASGRLEFDGRITSPAISGRLAVENGELTHAPLGLNVSAMNLVLSGTADQATLEGRAESGDGWLRIAGEARLTDGGWRVESRIEGDRFALADTSWLVLSASPEIDLSARPERIEIDGDIRIAQLEAGLPPGSDERVTPSPDVEVIGEDETEEDPLPAAARRIEGRLGIDLGDQARLAAAGLETELAGDLELIWNGPTRPNGRGTIRLPSGSYRAYGQTLEISDGEVVFTGHPIDNPRLDIRAVREIFGDPEVEAAGVHIAGNARNPDIGLYTDPPTSEEKALAYVVTGADFDHAGGQGALNVGFYLLPKLFVSYGVGLFETGNVLSGRYELSRRWGVRVVSGERDTGVDLSYTVNN